MRILLVEDERGLDDALAEGDVRWRVVVPPAVPPLRRTLRDPDPVLSAPGFCSRIEVPR